MSTPTADPLLYQDLPGRTMRFELAQYGERDGKPFREHAITAYVTVAIHDGKPAVVTFSGVTMGSSDNANLAAVGKLVTRLLAKGEPFEEVRKDIEGMQGGPIGRVLMEGEDGPESHAVSSLLDAVAKWTAARWWEGKEGGDATL